MNYIDTGVVLLSCSLLLATVCANASTTGIRTSDKAAAAAAAAAWTPTLTQFMCNESACSAGDCTSSTFKMNYCYNSSVVNQTIQLADCVANSTHRVPAHIVVLIYDNSVNCEGFPRVERQVAEECILIQSSLYLLNDCNTEAPPSVGSSVVVPERFQSTRNLH